MYDQTLGIRLSKAIPDQYVSRFSFNKVLKKAFKISRRVKNYNLYKFRMKASTIPLKISYKIYLSELSILVGKHIK